MKILMVSPYPPLRDGIASYALQSVTRLRREGHSVEVVSPFPSAAHYDLELNRWRGEMQLARRARHYDRMIVQYHPDLFFPIAGSHWTVVRIATLLAIAWHAVPDVEVRVHEADYQQGRGGPAALAVRAMWHAPSRIVVHTETERNAFHTAFGVPLEHISVEQHGDDFIQRTRQTREQARARLDVGTSDVVFLCIGFIQPHKGFDRAIRAFGSINGAAAGARLDIVGSLRLEQPEYLDHLEELRRSAHATPGVHLHVAYVSDEEFDTWIVASDVVVLPYRHIWSSGVLERATLYERPVIASRVGGLPDQANHTALLVDDDAALADAMRHVLAQRGLSPRVAPPTPWPTRATADREAVMQVIRTRAALSRSSTVPAGSSHDADGATVARQLDRSAALRRIPPLELPPAFSSRPGATPAKRLVQRLTRWQLDPIVQQLNRLQKAIEDAVEQAGTPDAPPGSDKVD